MNADSVPKKQSEIDASFERLNKAVGSVGDSIRRYVSETEQILAPPEPVLTSDKESEKERQHSTLAIRLAHITEVLYDMDSLVQDAIKRNEL